MYISVTLLVQKVIETDEHRRFTSFGTLLVLPYKRIIREFNMMSGYIVHNDTIGCFEFRIRRDV